MKLEAVIGLSASLEYVYCALCILHNFTYFLLKISIKFLSAVMYVLEAENFTLALGSQIYIEGFHCPPLRFNFVCNIHICISREIG